MSCWQEQLTYVYTKNNKQKTLLPEDYLIQVGKKEKLTLQHITQPKCQFVLKKAPSLGPQKKNQFIRALSVGKTVSRWSSVFGFISTLDFYNPAFWLSLGGALFGSILAIQPCFATPMDECSASYSLGFACSRSNEILYRAGGIKLPNPIYIIGELEQKELKVVQKKSWYENGIEFLCNHNGFFIGVAIGVLGTTLWGIRVGRKNETLETSPVTPPVTQLPDPPGEIIQNFGGYINTAGENMTGTLASAYNPLTTTKEMLYICANQLNKVLRRVSPELGSQIREVRDNLLTLAKHVIPGTSE